MKHVYPFAALVGQDDMKQALLIAAIDPLIGGVLVFGDRGTGKSTAVRSLAALLPPMQAESPALINAIRSSNQALALTARARASASRSP